MRTLNKALVARLDGDKPLQALLRSGLSKGEEVPAMERSDRTDRDYRVWEAFVEVHNIFNQEGDRWLTFEVTADAPDANEQTEDVRELSVMIHVWCRESDSDPAEQIDDRVRALLNRSHLDTDGLHAWWLLVDDFYVKEPLEATRGWHIARRYSGLFVQS